MEDFKSYSYIVLYMYMYIYKKIYKYIHITFLIYLLDLE